MDHLGCFIAGMFALTSEHTEDADRKAHYRQIGADTANTCHQSYIQTGARLLSLASLAPSDW